METSEAAIESSFLQTTACANTLHYLGVDLGMGAIKLYDAGGGLQLPSFVAAGGAVQVAALTGFARQIPPMQLQVGEQPYYVGLHAHDYGRPIENLDYDRLTASPEIVALFYVALTQRIRTYGAFAHPLTCLVGMPLETLAEEQPRPLSPRCANG